MTNYSQQYFTIESLEVGNVITLTIGSGVGPNNLYYVSWSKDLVNWNRTDNISGEAVTITVNADIENVYWKGSGQRFNSGGTADNTSKFSATKAHNVSGNPCSLIFEDNFTSVTSLTMSHQLRNVMNNDTTLVSAKNLVFPFTSITGDSALNSFFSGCASLEEAPILPLATLYNYTYSNLFSGCSKLNKIICLATDISASNCLQNWVRNISATGIFYKHPSMTSWTSGNNGIPSGWTISDYYEDYSQQYLTVQSEEDSNTITLTIGSDVTSSQMTSISYSTDSGTNWTTTNVDSTTQTINVSLNRGDKALFKGVGTKLATNYATSGTNYITAFSSTKNYIVYGNIMSMLYGDNFSDKINVSSNYAFCGLFYNSTTLIYADNLVMPITDVAQETTFCDMFNNCTALITPPQFSPVSVGGLRACMRMFYNCRSLLSTTNFDNFTTINGNNVMYDMFHNCVSLVNAPKILKPKNLTQYCYGNMFAGCVALTTAPILPASTLANYCYQGMFRECSNLNYVACLATDISASNCTTNWLYSVAATGTFYKHPSMNSWSSGVNGIPSGWTTEDYKAFMINGNIPETIKIVHNGVTRYIKYLKFGENLVWEYDGEIPTPSYTQVSYIKTTSLSSEDTGYYYFDTGISSPTSGTIEIDMQFMPLGNNGSIYFGHDGGGSDSRDFRLFWYENTVFCDVGAGRNYTSTNASFNELKHWVWTVDYSTLEFGVKVYGESSNFIYNEFWGSVTVQHILINLSPMKFKSMTIKKNGTTVFDGVAAIDANNVPCIYDSISDTKIYNSGSGQDSGMTYEQ